MIGIYPNGSSFDHETLSSSYGLTFPTINDRGTATFFAFNYVVIGKDLTVRHVTAMPTLERLQPELDAALAE